MSLQKLPGRKRIELTDYCRDFCSKNDEMTTYILKKMFASISEEQLQVTIQTIIGIEDNLKMIKGEGTDEDIC